MKVKIKSLKVNLSKINFEDPDQVNDGTNGKILEQEMMRQGFPINQNGTVDLPGIEVKSRKASTDAMHTVGTMTYDDIVATPWNQTPFKKKLQTQYRVTINKDEFGGDVSAIGKVVDFSNPEIQKELEDAYEKCRAELIAQGQIYVGQTITAGGQYGKLEHKPGPNGTGKSYALRIPNSGMKKMLTMANSTFNQLFESN
tara:strand:+ start:1051 stop:1647 length:597 start_codon:yes stop_codon:yes gene_type:complete